MSANQRCLLIATACLATACASSPSSGWRGETLSAVAAEVPLPNGTLQPVGVRAQEDEKPAKKPKQSTKPVSNFTLLLANRSLDDEFFWTPLEEPSVFGFEYDAYVPGSLGYEFGMHFANASEQIGGIDLESSTFEMNVGGRKTWEKGNLRPYLGAGLALLATNLDIDNGAYDEGDGSIGCYIHGGAYYKLGSSLTIGADYRMLIGTEIDLPGFVTTDVDYDQLAITLGFAF